MEEHIKKWRLILGKDADSKEEIELEGEALGMDGALEILYDSEGKAGLGKSSPKVNRWLGDIRKYFPSSMVQVMQKDAMERLNLKELLLEPEMLESVEMNVDLVATILSLNKVMPNKTKDTARIVVKKVVDELIKKLANPMREAIIGALNRSVRNRRPKLNEMDWHRTIKANMKHYQKEYNSIIPEQLWGFGRKGQSLKNVILAVDQSGSMASSLVYSGILGAVMASLPSVKTHMLVFDTEIADLTAQLNEPVDLLFATQLGGGTDINKALHYADNLITQPDDTVLVLITDLFEGGNINEMFKKAASIKAKGVTFVTLLALNDEGNPIYDKQVAQQLYGMGIPCFACTPDLFPDLMSAALKKEDIYQWMAKHDIVRK